VCCDRLRFQFVLEVDELLFDVFAPQPLKDAMDDAKQLELPPLRPTLKRLPDASVGKIAATLVLVAVFTATIIAPQTQLARDAGIVLCGTSLLSVSRNRAGASLLALRRWFTQLGERSGPLWHAGLGRPQ